jgi:tetratricopeptide (TPR) repeat protein
MFWNRWDKTIKLTAEWAKDFGIKDKPENDNQGNVEIKIESIKEEKEKILIRFSFIDEKNNKSQTVQYLQKTLTPFQATFVGWAFVVLSDSNKKYKERAKYFLENATRQRSNSCLPYFLLVDSGLEENKDDGIRDLYIALQATDIFPDYYLLLGREETNQFKANGVIEKGWTKFPHNIALTSTHLRNLFNKNQYKECLEIINKSQPFEGTDFLADYHYINIVFYIFESHIKLKQYEEAKNIMSNSSINDEEKSFFLALLLFYQDKYAEAEKVFIATLEMPSPASDTIQASLCYLLGCYQKNHDIQQIKKIVELLPKTFNDFTIIPFHFDYNDFAEQTLRMLLKENLDELTKSQIKGFLSYLIWSVYLSQITNNRALTQKEKRLYEESLRLIKEALQFYPDNSFFNIIASNFYSFKKDYNNAIIYGFRSLLNKKDSIFSLLDDGHSSLEKCSEDFLGKYADSIKNISEKENVPVNIYIDQWFSYDIDILFKKKQYKTITDLFTWVKEHKDWKEIAEQFQKEQNELGKYAGGGLFEIAYSLNEMGGLKEAENLYEHLLKIKSGSSAIFNNLALIYEKSGNLMKAREMIKKAKKITGRQEDEIVNRNFSRLIKNSQKHSNANQVSEKKESSKNIRLTPTFDMATGEIIFGDKKCPIPLSSNQFQLCKAIFNEKTLGEWVKETEIIETFYKGTDSTRSFYDAGRLVNQKIQEKTGIKNMLEYKASSIRIRKEIFNNPDKK